MKEFLIDANIIIGARKGDPNCLKILGLAEEGRISLATTDEISQESKMPSYVRIISVPKSKRTAYDYTGLQRYLKKNYGRGGKREEPSAADKSLVQAFIHGSYSGIISDDADIGYVIYSQLTSNILDIIFLSQEFIERRIWE